MRLGDSFIRCPSFSLILALHIFAQIVRASPFQNLDFEQASIRTVTTTNFTPWDAYKPIDASLAVPFWTPREDDIIVTALWGYPGLDETSIALVTAEGRPVGYPLEGQYSIFFSAAWFGNPQYYQRASISQLGDVPASSRSIRYLLGKFYSTTAANPTVSVDGQVIPTFPLSITTNIMTMIGDIGSFAGKTVELKFECDLSPAENYFVLDAISFSPVPLLSITNSVTDATLMWPSSMTNYVLETSLRVGTGAVWTSVTNPVDTGLGLRSATVAMKTNVSFFRLRSLD